MCGNSNLPTSNHSVLSQLSPQPNPARRQAFFTCFGRLFRSRPRASSCILLTVTMAETLALMQKEPPKKPQGKTSAHIHDGRSQSTCACCRHTFGSQKQIPESGSADDGSKARCPRGVAAAVQPPAGLPPSTTEGQVPQVWTQKDRSLRSNCGSAGAAAAA